MPATDQERETQKSFIVCDSHFPGGHTGRRATREISGVVTRQKGSGDCGPVSLLWFLWVSMFTISYFE